MNPEATARGIMDEDALLRTLLEGTVAETGKPFFAALVKNLSAALNTYGAWVTEYLEDCRRLRALAFWLDDDFLDHWEIDIDGTPCEQVVVNQRLVHYPENVMALFPRDPELVDIEAVSYMGVPLLDGDGHVMGHLAVIDKRPMPEQPHIVALFRIFAARAAAELRRIRAEAGIREREEKLSRLFNSAMDAIIELDAELRITSLNAAAAKLLGNGAEAALLGREFRGFLQESDAGRLDGLIRELDTRPPGEQYLWVPGGLGNICAECVEFPAEATLARFEMRRRPFYSLILRNINERLEAERRIERLTVQTEYLREELRALGNFGEIIGESEAILRVLHDIEQVASTDATVLLCGETGTGKEVIARTIHAAGDRSGKPFVRVNCAAIPANLIESEFFGHERGAFTGATARREGRFALADGGTLFLDEIGELPLDLQAKLLRVLQEGEFEPVGSSQTRKVDVRVLAATNRDLADAVERKEFREDLYYRLNVFPLELPPLRERGDDVILLARKFMEQFARRFGRTLQPLTPECERRLKAYSWPGNVRELQNVIERAVITSRNGRLNLDRALPEPVGASPSAEDCAPSLGTRESILSVSEMEELERANMLRALEQCGWRVSGPQGAAALLGIKPSTLSSRMKALGLQRPRATNAAS
jgi:PAS domain S-box-containing protein